MPKKVFNIMSIMQNPPKEGRMHPGLSGLDHKRYRRMISKRRLLIFTVVLIGTFFLWHTLGETSISGSETKRYSKDLKTNFKRAEIPESDWKETSIVPAVPLKPGTPDNQTPTSRIVTALKKPDGDNKVSSNANVHPKDFSIIGQHARVETRSLAKQQKLGSSPFQRQPEMEAALSRVVTSLPGEMHMRDLLRPVEGTGKEKLHEMGLRTRSYGEFFQIWEDLHIVSHSDGTSYIRNDIVQYLTQLRENPKLATQGAGIFSSMTTGQIIRSYETYRHFLAKFGELLFPYTSPFFPDHMSLHLQFKNAQRGIVLTAGDDQAHFLMTTIYSFRKLGCNLPIEVMYLGDSDLSEDYRAELESIEGVVTRDVSQMVNDEGWKLAGWAIKAFAILFSSFREVIFIDADSAFFQDPAVLFDDPEYQKNGALFFKDRLMMPESKKRWVQQVLPKPFSPQVKQNRFWTGESAHMQESGVVVVDKWKHFLSMLLVTRMNGPDRDGDEDQGIVGVYDMVYGDKETFWLGWELSGDFKYAFHKGDAGTMGVVNQTHHIDIEDDVSPEEEHTREHEKSEDHQGHNGRSNDNFTICAPQLLHLDTNGKPLWFNGWVLDNKFADKSHKQFAAFEDYVVEPHNWEGEDAWQLQQDNQCCLTTYPGLKFEFTKAEKGVLSMIIERAKDIEAAVLS